MGHGTVRAAHGDLPNPPPAVARLLAQRHVPVVGVETTMELATPTGVAVLVALADRFGALPAMTVERASATAPARPTRPAGPNVVQVVVGTATDAEPHAPARAAPPCSWRSTSTTSPARCWPTPSPRSSPPAPTTPGPRRS